MGAPYTRDGGAYEETQGVQVSPLNPVSVSPCPALEALLGGGQQLRQKPCEEGDFGRLLLQPRLRDLARRRTLGADAEVILAPPCIFCMDNQ